MKSVMLLMSMLFLQNPTQDELKTRFEKKLQSPFLKKAAWLTDYEGALAAAAKDNKMILAYFTRSYEPAEKCDEMEAGLLSETTFIEWSKNVVLLCQIATGLDGRPFDRLWCWRCPGFPSLVILDSKGHALTAYLHKTGMNYLPTLLKDADVLRERARLATAGAGFPQEFFELAVEVNYFNSFEEGRGFHAGLKDVDGPMKDRLAGLLAVLEYREIVVAIGDLRNKDKMAEASGKCVTMARAGRIPGMEPEKMSFWRGVVEGSETAGDAVLMEQALTATRGYPGTGQDWLKKKEAALQKLKDVKK